MFRISKNDDSIESHDPKGEGGVAASPSDESGTVVPSSTLRWLRRPQTPSEGVRADAPLAAAEAHGDNGGDGDELELSGPLERADDDQGRPDAGGSAGSVMRVPPVANPETGTRSYPLEYDDDDDTDDFDELRLDDGAAPPEAPERQTFFPEIDLDGASSPDVLDAPLPLAVDLGTAEPAARDPADDGHMPAVDPAAYDTPILRRSRRAGLLEEDEATPASEASLALQPIPELQASTSGQPIRAPSRPPQPEDDPASLAEDDDDDDLDALELEPLDPERPDQAEDGAEDDWHAQLADALGHAGEDGPPDALPLSRTLAQIAVARHDDPMPGIAFDDVVPPLPIRTARQKMAESQVPTTLPPERADLSPTQLSLAVVANVPRLRRLAAVQIGDELEADRLVRITVEAALADRSALKPAGDLGLTLITLLHRHRQDMLAAPTALPRPPESARAFETALCRGLAGADQFEVHQFARAINGLDEQDRQLLVLVALENLAYEQIAAVIGDPVEMIMALVSRARLRLRQALTNDDRAMDGRTSAVHVPHAQEVEINGYLDGELDGHHMADVDALVEYDEDAADRLLNYGIQGDLIRRLYAPLLNRPIPTAMLDAIAAAARPARRGFRFGSRRMLLIGAVLLTVAASLYVAPLIGGRLAAEASAEAAAVEP